jgi:hypothetical protein
MAKKKPAPPPIEEEIALPAIDTKKFSEVMGINNGDEESKPPASVAGIESLKNVNPQTFDVVDDDIDQQYKELYKSAMEAAQTMKMISESCYDMVSAHYARAAAAFLDVALKAVKERSGSKLMKEKQRLAELKEMFKRELETNKKGESGPLNITNSDGGTVVVATTSDIIRQLREKSIQKNKEEIENTINKEEHEQEEKLEKKVKSRRKIKK